MRPRVARLATNLHGSEWLRSALRGCASFGLVLFLPLLVNVFLFASVQGYVKAAISGMCPGHPPDIAPRPCTTAQYLAEAWGPWDVAGAFVWSIMWALVLTAAWLPYAVGPLAHRRLGIRWSFPIVVLCLLPIFTLSFLVVGTYGAGTTLLYLMPPSLIAAAMLFARSAGSHASGRKAMLVVVVGLSASLLAQALLSWAVGAY